MAIGRTIGGILAFIWHILDGVRKTLHLILLLFLFAIVIAALQSSIPIVPSSAALILNLEGRIVEQYTGDPIERAFARAASPVAPETQLRDVLDALRAAATDKRIQLAVLDLQHFEGAGLPQLQEIAAAMESFRASGKKIIAVSDSYDQAGYYLAAHADEIQLDPLGAVLIEGFASTQYYFKEALDKLGVDINVFKVGTHKSATEVFTRTDMSPEEREQTRAWLDALWKTYQEEVTRARSLPADAIASYVRQAVPLLQAAGGDAARVALEQGLVTAVRTRAQLNEELIAAVGRDKDTHQFKSVELQAYVAATRAEQRLKKGGNQIGILVASGEILEGPQPPGKIGDESLVRIIREARDDANIKALVLRVDSPGGSMIASEQIYRELLAFKESGKPLIASMGTVAASGGYYISMGADEIWASPTTITGSIGVFALVPTFQNTLKKLGITTDGVGTTELAGQLRMDRRLSPEVRALLQTSVEHAYAEFLARVSRHRNQPAEAIDRVAQGRVWSGSDARTHGLVDGLGRLQVAIDSAAMRANLGGEYTVRYLEARPTWPQSLGLKVRAVLARLALALGVDRLFGFGNGVPALARPIVDPVQNEFERLARFNDPRNLYSYCFCAAP